MSGHGSLSQLAGPKLGRKPIRVTETEVDTDDENKLFHGLNTGPINKVIWYQEDSGIGGVYWLAQDEEGFYWVSDGVKRIAVAVHGRIFRFFRRGIGARINYLLKRYLGYDAQTGKTAIPLEFDSSAVSLNFGANIGELSLGLNGVLGNSIVSIEPDAAVLPALRANCIGRNISVVPVAAWNVDAKLPIYVKTVSADTSFFNVSSHKAVVQAERIDTIAARLGLDRVHLLAGDAEGAEPEVLDGAREVLKRTRYVSVCASAERCGESTQDVCEKILTDAGFETIRKEDSKFRMLIARNANTAAR